ncbi:DEAD (Asp-Glu-Ala-Asp) box polypeptide 23 [Chytridiales sp. JEL 0842]|nr:DEAD (Asp-Glu-Ala-Asp) box polypeptide 23 [Chytridiales sp. JEL 0842]
MSSRDYGNRSGRSDRRGSPPPRDYRDQPYRGPDRRDGFDRRDGYDRNRNRDSRYQNGYNGHPDDARSFRNEMMPPPPPPPPEEPLNAPPPPPPEEELKTKRVPLSLEELLAKKKEEKEAADKPVFLSKEERAKLALEKRAREVEEKRAKEEEERKAREGFFKESATVAASSSRYLNRDNYADNRRSRYDGGRRNDRYDRHERPPPVTATAKKPELEPSVPLAEKELQGIREKYMGTEKKKRRIRRMNEKKFVFDWAADEDTSVDFNPIYAKKHDVQLFGKGLIADVNYILDALPLANVKPEDEMDVDGDGNDIPDLIVHGRKYRQTVMFSATMPPAVERLAQKYLRRPAVVTIGTAGQAVDRIEQRVEMIHDDNRKKQRLIDLLSGEFKPPVIIFVNQRKSCDVLAKALDDQGFKTTTLHGGKSQDQREASLAALKTGAKEVLIATDVAGRGIDVKHVSLVVNYDMAKSIEDYTHRIGRTGRAGEKGVAITFLSNSDTDVYYDLKQMLMKTPGSRIPPELANHEAAMRRVEGGQRKRKTDDQ